MPRFHSHGVMSRHVYVSLGEASAACSTNSFRQGPVDVCLRLTGCAMLKTGSQQGKPEALRIALVLGLHAAAFVGVGKLFTEAHEIALPLSASCLNTCEGAACSQNEPACSGCGSRAGGGYSGADEFNLLTMQ